MNTQKFLILIKGEDKTEDLKVWKNDLCLLIIKNVASQATIFISFCAKIISYKWTLKKGRLWSHT